MIAGDVFRIVDRQLIQSQRILNTYFYSVGSVVGVPTLDDISTKFSNDVTSPVAAVQSNGLTHDRLDIDNLSNLVEFGQFEIIITGVQAGVTTAPFVALGWKLNRTTKITRNGAKRVGGVTEDEVTAGLPDISALEEANINAAFAQVLLVVNGGNSVDLTPVIVGRMPDGSLDLTKLNVIASADLQTVTSQNSRKFGVGI